MKKIKLFVLLSMFCLLLFACSNVRTGDENNNSNERVNSKNDSVSSSNSSESVSNIDYDILNDSIRNNLKTGQVEIKGFPTLYSPDSGKMIFNATAKKVVIDWGDGTIEEIISNGVKRDFSHNYPSGSIQTVTINTENLTYFYTDSYSTDCYEVRFGDCPYLKELDFDSNSLTVLEINKVKSLKSLFIEDSKLKQLDLSDMTSLEKFDAFRNRSLSQINLGGLTSLKSLGLYRNTSLKEIDVSGLTSLENFTCYLTMSKINIKNCISLKDVSFESCYLNTECLNAIFEDLPVRKDDEKARIFIGGINSGASTCDREIATAKGWNVEEDYY